MSSLSSLLQPHHHEGESNRERQGDAEEARRLREAISARLSDGKENAHPTGRHSGRREGLGSYDTGLEMKSGVRGLQQMRRHGDKARDFNDNEYEKTLQLRLKSRPF